MIHIEIDNSYSRITGLSLSAEKTLRQALSYTVGGSSAFFSGRGIQRRSLVDKRGNFPTGLLHRAVEHLPLSVQQIKISDLRKKPKLAPNPAFTNRGAYPWQRAALDEAVARQRGIISATTGSGKSRVIALIAQYLNLRTLVVVPSLEIKKQLSEAMKGLKNVTVLNIDSTALETATDFDVLIIDEAHHAAAKTYRKLNKTAWKGIFYRYFLTATPFRNDTEEQLLFEAIAGQVIYSLGYQEAVEKRYVVPIEAYYIDLPKKPTEAFTWAEVYRELVVENEERNSTIAAMLLLLASENKSTLCLVKEVKHGRILADKTGLPFVTGEDDDSRLYIKEFNEGRISGIIATTGIMAEGVDSKACEFVMIAGLGKAKSNFMQACGRCIRRFGDKESGKVIIFRDRSHKYTLRHYREQAKILTTEYGVKPLKLAIS